MQKTVAPTGIFFFISLDCSVSCTLFRYCSGIVLVLFRYCSGIVLVLFCYFSGIFPVFRYCSGIVPVLFRYCSGIVPVLFRYCSGIRLKTACRGFFHYEKSDGFGRERTRNLGFQRAARKPLDHRSGNWLTRNNFCTVQYRSECIYILQIHFIKKKRPPKPLGFFF
jgi:hypothetical protein